MDAHPDRAEQVNDWLDEHLEHPPTDRFRCPWVLRLHNARCARKRGHRGFCRIEYANRPHDEYRGINWPDPPRPL